MSHEHGPLGDLRENLTGAAAGRYGAHPLDDVADVSDTQAPAGRTADPLGRRPDGARPEDESPLLERDEDADGAPEL